MREAWIRGGLIVGFCRHCFKNLQRGSPGTSTRASCGCFPADYLVSAGLVLVEAIAAVHRSVAAGQEGYFGVLATLGAYGWVHLPRGSVPVAATATEPTTTTVGFPGGATRRTTFGFIGEAFAGMELLIVGAEGERGAAIEALKLLVLIRQWMTSSLNTRSESWSSILLCGPGVGN